MDRSVEAGLDFLDLTRSALFVDLDNDGDQDLVQALRRELLVMENDGRMDLYVSNMFSGAGNRITFQDRFMPEADSSVRRQFQRHARGNSLLLNQGEGEPFEDLTAQAGVGVGRWAWSSTFADLNNDTLADILVANGYVTEVDTTDL